MSRGRGDTVDLVWLVIPAAVGIFVLRAVMIARKLKLAAQAPTLADVKALRDAKESLRAHEDHLEAAIAAPKAHLAAARNLSRLSTPRARAPSGGLDSMVEDFLPERRF